MNFESFIALLLLIENNGRYLLVNIDDPSSPVENLKSTDIKSYARSRGLGFRHKKFRSMGDKNTDSGKNEHYGYCF